MSRAIYKGHTAMCHYLHAQRCPWHSSALRQAALFGHADLLRLLVNNCCYRDDDLLRAAAQGGSIEVLTYLQELGLLDSASMLTEMLNVAALGSKLAAAKWLRAQGAEWPAEFGLRPWDGEVLEWARAEGCTTLITPKVE
jgi:hypothetical protein